MRAAFRRLDSGGHGHVPVSALLRTLRGDGALCSVMEKWIGRDEWTSLLEYLGERMLDSVHHSNPPLEGGGTITWGEFLLLLIPRVAPALAPAQDTLTALGRAAAGAARTLGEADAQRRELAWDSRSLERGVHEVWDLFKNEVSALRVKGAELQRKRDTALEVRGRH